MTIYHLFTVLILLTTLFTYLNNKIFKWPVTIAVTALTLFISIALLLLQATFSNINQLITSQVSDIHFNNIILNMALGFLLFSAAFKTDVPLFKDNLKIIASMAFFSTLISSFIVAVLVYYLFILFGLNATFIECLVFGALISPTDPIASIGVLRKLGISKSTEVKITGESLINDGIAIVTFTLFTNIASSGESDSVLQDALILLVREAGGAIVYGAILGWLALQLLKHTNDYKTQILVTLSIVTAGYTLADMIHISSPISMAVAGLFCSRSRKENKDHISDDVTTFWYLIEDFINIILFTLIGVEIFVIPLNSTKLAIGIISIVLLLLARYLSLFPIKLFFRKEFNRSNMFLYTWAALRGAVSIALALSIQPENHKSEFLSLTYIIAVFSIIVQGLTIKPFAQRLGFGK